MPPGARSFEKLKDDFFLDVMFSPLGKFGQYGICDDRKVVASTLEPLTLPSGSTQPYRRMSLKFAPLTYNGNTVERRAYLSATAVGGTVYILVAGSLATRWKKLEADLKEIQMSFRAIGAPASTRAAAASS